MAGSAGNLVVAKELRLVGRTYTSGSIDVFGAINNFALANVNVTIESGGFASNLTMFSGGETILAGGVGNLTNLRGGAQFVYGTANATTVGTGAFQQVSGSTYGTVLNGGFVSILANGAAHATVFKSGREVVQADALDTDASIGNGVQEVRGTATAATVSGNYLSHAATRVYGVQDVFGSASNTRVAGGREIVEVGGTSRNTTITAGEELVRAGGADYDATLSGGLQTVYGTATAATLTANDAARTAGYQDVFGLAVDTSVWAGWEVVEAGGTSRRGHIYGGMQIVQAGGADYGTQLVGGSQILRGTATGDYVSYGSVQTVVGAAYDTQLFGGEQVVYGVAHGTLVSRGVETVWRGGEADGAALWRGGVLDMKKGSTLSGEVDLHYGSQLTLEAGAINHATLALDAHTDVVIDLAGLKFDAAHSSYALLSGGIDITQGAAHQTLNLAGVDPAAQYSLSADATGGTCLRITS